MTTVELRCPIDQAVLTHEDDTLRCDRGHTYQVRAGIPRFVADEGYTDTFGFEWERHATTQQDSANGYTLSRERWFACTGWPDRLDGEVVLEAGSGAGRFTEIVAATGAELYTFDYSRAIDINCRNNVDRPNVTFLQADLDAPPFAPETFDRVFCMGVLQHTPDPGASFASIARLVKPGGHLAIDVYQKTVVALLHWKYVLRPITTRMDSARLYRVCEQLVPPLLGPWKILRRIGGRYATRLLPILSYGHLGIADELNRAWSILDTFDMYSPKYDKPKTQATVRRWFKEAGFVDVEVGWGPNGIVGRGRRPSA